eukprot:123269-Amphidinium_carterae.1
MDKRVPPKQLITWVVKVDKISGQFTSASLLPIYLWLLAASHSLREALASEQVVTARAEPRAEIKHCTDFRMDPASKERETMPMNYCMPALTCR